MVTVRKVALGVVGMTVALALFAFAGIAGTARAQTPPAGTPTPANTSHGISNLSCTFSPTPIQVNTAETVTCNFDYFGTAHTFVVDFDISTITPPLGLHVSSCTLDGSAFSGGPCP